MRPVTAVIVTTILSLGLFTPAWSAKCCGDGGSSGGSSSGGSSSGGSSGTVSLPEPGTLALLGLAGGALVLARVRRRR